MPLPMFLHQIYDQWANEDSYFLKVSALGVSHVPTQQCLLLSGVWDICLGLASLTGLPLAPRELVGGWWDLQVLEVWTNAHCRTIYKALKFYPFWLTPPFTAGYLLPLRDLLAELFPSLPWRRLVKALLVDLKWHLTPSHVNICHGVPDH